MLTLILLVIGVNGMKAQELSTLTADLSAITIQGSAVYTAEQHKLTFDAPWSCAAVASDITNIPVYQAKTLTITCSEATTGYRLDFYFTDGSSLNGSEAEGTRLSGDNAATAALSQTFDLTTILAAYQKKTIDYLRINTALAAADAEGGSYIVLSNIALAYDATAELEEEELGEGYVDLEASMFKAYASIEKDAEVTSDNPGGEFNIGKEVAAGGTIYGNGNVAALTYADLTGYDQLILTVSSGTPRLLFNRTADEATDYKEINSTSDELVTVDEDGKWVIDLTGIKTATGKEYVHLNVIKATWGGAATVKRAVLHEMPISYISAADGSEVDIRTAPSFQKDGDSYVAATTYTPSYRVNEETNVAYFGVDWSGENLNYYTDLTGYEKLRVYQETSSPAPRPFFENAAGDGHQNFAENCVWNAEGGYYELDLATVQNVVGNLRLTTLRPTGTGTVTKIVVTDKNSGISYILTGTGELDAAATAALADKTATIYDATGVTGSNLTLQAANPNAVFVANEGVLVSMNNVCVGGNIDMLNLTDGYPFAFPAGATVGTGAYFREQANEFGTVCLPFGITNGGAKLYVPESISGDALVLQEVNEVAAGVPAIVWAGAEDKSFEVTGDGALAEAKTSNGTVQLTGSYTDQVIDVTAEPGTSYYGISNNTFVKATKTLTVKPFRAYLTTSTADAKERLTLDTPEATAISALTAEDAAVEAVFNAAGARQNGLQKGLNIVKMNNGQTLKVVVK